SFDYETDFVDWNNQRLTAFDLSNMNCNEFSFQMKFKDNGIDKIIEKKVNLYNTEVSPDFILNKINTIQNDEGKAQIIYALNGFESFNSIREQLVENLKNSRDESLKCWPKGNCSVSQTTKILYYLKISGLSNNRIYQDARTWLISNSKIQLYDKYHLEIYKDEDVSSTTCEIKIEDVITSRSSSVEKYTVEITPKYPTYIDVECTPSSTDLILQGVEDFSFTDGNEEVKLLKVGDNELKYSMPSPCLLNEKGYCDIESTFYFLFLDVSENTRENVFRFFTKYLRNEGYDKVYFNAYEVYNTTRYDNINYLWTSLFYYTANYYSQTIKEVMGDSSTIVLNNIKNWLYYNQNNDGSWGKNLTKTEESIEFTSKIIDYLSKSKETQDENLKDAKQYILENINKVEKIESYASFYNMIKTDFTPIINFDPIFLRVRENLDVTILNPTPYIYKNMILELNLDDLLISTYNTQNRQFIASKYLKIDYLASKESKKVNIIKNELFIEEDTLTQPGIKFGYISVYLPSKDLDQEVFKNIDFDSKLPSKTIDTKYYEFENSLNESKESKNIKYDLKDYLLIGQIPIVFIDEPKFEAKIDVEQISYDGTVNGKITGKSNMELYCELKSPYTNLYSFRVEKKDEVSDFENNFKLDFIGQKGVNIFSEFTLECEYVEHSDYFEEETLKKSQNIIVYDFPPFEIITEKTITQKEHIIQVKNNLETQQTIIVNILENDNDYFYLNKNTITINPHQTQQIILQNNVPRKKYSISKILLSFLGNEKDINLELRSNINPEVYEKQIEKEQQELLEEAKGETKGLNPIILISIIIILFLVVTFFGLIFLQKTKKINVKFLQKIV
ncbi:MAG: hypothetical protein PHT94_05335, partial [Candidatus Nanoarchaeia archaeon]|nr:hypothetical protein [Candidatus Nanoarchaeia archaeon]